MECLFILDFPTKNYEVHPLISNSITLLKHVPHRATISKQLKPKTKTSELAREFGPINSSGYLNEEDAIEVKSTLDVHKQLIEDSTKVVTFGSISTKLFTGLTLKQARGREHSSCFSHAQKIFAMYHPDQIFSDKWVEKGWQSQFARMQNFAYKSSSEFKSCETIIIEEEELQKILTDQNIGEIAVDLETSGFNWIDIAGVSWSDKLAYVVENPSLKFGERILHGRKIVFHKGTYDIPFLIELCNLDLTKIELHDTSYMSRIQNPQELYALDELALRVKPEWGQWKQYKGK